MKKLLLSALLVLLAAALHAQEFYRITDIDDGERALEVSAVSYLDASENPENYDGKTVRFKGYIYRGRNIGKDEYVPGRMGMVCCAEDVRFVGFIAKANGLPIPQPKTWQMITAEVKAEERTQYKGVGPVLYVTKIEPCEPPEEEVVTFNQ